MNRAARRTVFRERQADEALLFQLGLCAARTSAALLWPRADAKGRELVRSPFADEAARALGRSAEGVPLAAIPAAADCAGPSELLARGALDAFAEPAYRVTPPADREQARALAGALTASSLGARFRRIARAALAERERVRTFTGEIRPGRFSGGLSGAALQIAAARFAFGTDAPLSASVLEAHATCGFRTLGRKLLRLEVDEEDDEELGPRERGKLLHRCLERFFRRVRDEGHSPGDLALLREVAEAEMDAFALEEHVGHRGLWALRRDRFTDDLAALVEAEAELERSFGFDDSEWPALQIGDVRVRGIIDRVDRLPDGTLLVMDYKSSAKPTLQRKLKEALRPEFQLALYAAVVRQQWPGTPVQALYVSIKDAERTKPLPDLADQLPGALQEQVAQMRGGLFPARPLTCEYCQLEPACRLVALPTDPDENGGETPRA